MSGRRRLAESARLVFISASLAWLGLHLLGLLNPFSLVWNRTASIPVGAYLAKELRGGAVQVGDVVCFDYHAPSWAGDRDYFPEGHQLCKPVAAIEGDRLEVSTGLVRVFGASGAVRLEAGIADADSARRALPSSLASGLVPPGTVILIAGAHLNSLDSRYLGPVSVRALSRTLLPVWVR